MGTAPAAGDQARPRGRGGTGSQLSDVRWGMIFKMGWHLMGFFKVLVIGYALMMLIQNCVTMGTSQVMGEVTNAMSRFGQTNKSAGPTAESNTPPANAPATAPSESANPPQRSPLALVVLWSAAALVAMLVRLPMKAVATHCARSCPIANWSIRSGTATLTMVEDITDAMLPIMIVASSFQRWLEDPDSAVGLATS